MSNSSTGPCSNATVTAAPELLDPRRVRVDVARCKRLKFAVVYLRGVCRVLGYDLEAMRIVASEMGEDPRALFDKFDYERTNQLLIRQFADRLELLHQRLTQSVNQALASDAERPAS